MCIFARAKKAPCIPLLADAHARFPLPNTKAIIKVGRQESLRALGAATAAGGEIVLALERPSIGGFPRRLEDLYPTAVLASIKKTEKKGADSKVSVEGIGRVQLRQLIGHPYLQVSFRASKPARCVTPVDDDARRKLLSCIRELRAHKQHTDPKLAPDLDKLLLEYSDDAASLADRVAGLLSISTEEATCVLTADDYSERMDAFRIFVHARMIAEDRKWVFSLLSDLISKHINALISERLRYFRSDPYGNTIRGKWDKAIAYFLHRVFLPSVPSDLSHTALERYEQLTEHVEMTVASAQQMSQADLSSPPPGVAFEHYCGDLLRKHGWEVRVGRGTHDQGVDIFAWAAGVTVAIQCKNCQDNVGNAAVQEVVAGARHHGARSMVVVCTSGYTQPARDLARTNGVHLLHYTDLPRLRDILKQP